MLHPKAVYPREVWFVTMTNQTSILFTVIVAVLCLSNDVARSFSPISLPSHGCKLSSTIVAQNQPARVFNTGSSFLQLSSEDTTEMSESDQTLLGAAGTFASLVTFYSEFTLKTTGCGLPAGPFGLVGLVEGLSYLGVTGLVAYSLVAKVKTVSIYLFYY